MAWRIVQEWIEEFAGKLFAIVMDTVDGGDGAMMVMEIGLAVSNTHTRFQDLIDTVGRVDGRAVLRISISTERFLGVSVHT